MDLYREIILDHYKHPRNFGHMEQADVVVEELNLSCGDKITMELKFSSNNSPSSAFPSTFAKASTDESAGRQPIRQLANPQPTTHNSQHTTLSSICFSGIGCAVSQASASMLTEKVTGQKISEIMSLKPADVVELLGIELTPTRLKCALLSLEVLQKGVTAYLNKK